MGYFALSTRVNSTGVSCYQKDVTKYVMKRLFKSSVVLSNEVKHVLDEAKILGELTSPFILCMLGKFQTCDELVFVFEIVPSGDLWSLIHERDELRDAEGFLSIEITRFYIANIILALEHMHVKNIAYRNLKPENILMGADGYVKISGMAFAKVILTLIVIVIIMLVLFHVIVHAYIFTPRLKRSNNVISTSAVFLYVYVCVCVCVCVFVFFGLSICLHTHTPLLPISAFLHYHTYVDIDTYLLTIFSNFLSTHAHSYVHLFVRTFLDRAVYDQPGVPSSDIIHILRNTRYKIFKINQE